MRELTVRIRFTSPCLGNVKRPNDTRFHLPRSGDRVTFLATWHHANLRLAAQLLGRHQDEVGKFLWDIAVDGSVRTNPWHRRYYHKGKRQLYCLHESFQAGQIVGLNCAVPASVVDDDVWRLLDLAGKYKGLSPYQPGKYGFFVVESVRSRRPHYRDGEDVNPVELVEKREEPGLPTRAPSVR